MSIPPNPRPKAVDQTMVSRDGDNFVRNCPPLVQTTTHFVSKLLPCISLTENMGIIISIIFNQITLVVATTSHESAV